MWLDTKQNSVQCLHLFVDSCLEGMNFRRILRMCMETFMLALMAGWSRGVLWHIMGVRILNEGFALQHKGQKLFMTAT